MEESLDYTYENPEDQSAPGSDFSSPLASDMFEDLVDLRYTVCFIRPDLDLDCFQGVVLDGERRGPRVLK